MIRAHRIRLAPNNKQATYFAKASGIARLAYNRALAEWQRQYEEDKEYREACALAGIDVDPDKLNRPSQGKLRKQLNAIKREQYPFMMEVTKCAPQLAIMQLGDAYKKFFKGEAHYPNFRKKGVNDRFSLSNDQFAVRGNKIRIPNLGMVRMREKLRFDGKILSATVSKRGGHWYVSISVEVADEVVMPTPEDGVSVGIDMGITHFAVLSDGTKIAAPKPLKRELKKLQRLSRSLSRKQKGSANRVKAKTKLSRLHHRIQCIRKDFLHKLTTGLVRQYDSIAIEDLNVKGMVTNRRLSRAINDVGMYEFKRQLVYKATEQGKEVKSVARFYPSSKTCSGCGHVLLKADITLAVRKWQCPACRQHHDRDINAAINILNHADKVLTKAA